MNVKENILNFWKNFEQASPELLKALEQNDYVALQKVLEPLNNESYKISGAHLFVEDSFEQPELTFDTGPNKTTQLICKQLKSLAPASVKKTWIINAQLPPLSQKAIEAQIQIKDTIYTLADFTVFYQVDNQTQSFVCDLYCSGFDLIENPEHKREMCIYLLELAVGLNYLEAYISSVNFTNEPKKDEKFVNLTELYDVIDQTIVRNHWKDYKDSLDIHSAYEPHQDIANDSLRKDMKLIHTIHPTLIEENLAGVHDSLLDLKEKGGEYGYIYWANMYEGKENALFRQELSKQLSQLLAPLHVAGVIGGAIGKSYSYIDLIVYSPKEFLRAFAQIQQQLKGKIELHYRPFEKDVK